MVMIEAPVIWPSDQERSPLRSPLSSLPHCFYVCSCQSYCHCTSTTHTLIVLTIATLTTVAIIIIDRNLWAQLPQVSGRRSRRLQASKNSCTWKREWKMGLKIFGPGPLQGVIGPVIGGYGYLQRGFRRRWVPSGNLGS